MKASSGAFLAIAISRRPLNLSFFIGLITLIGVSVNNGIILTDYINRRQKAGISNVLPVIYSIMDNLIYTPIIFHSEEDIS